MYEDFTDERLIEMFNGGEQLAFEELYRRYYYLINSITRSYNFWGGDESDDIHQEATLAFWKAIKDYDPSKAKFSTYACTCIKNRVLNVARQLGGEKHKIINEGISLVDELQVLAPSEPEDIVIGNENRAELLVKVQGALSEFEYRVFLLFFVEGRNYRAIAQDLRVEQKAVDNALQRVKTKLKKLV